MKLSFKAFRDEFGNYAVLAYSDVKTMDRVNAVDLIDFLDVRGKNATEMLKVAQYTICYATFFKTDSPYCHNLYVFPDFARKGIATKMYNWIERKFSVILNPAPDQSDDGKAFWKKRLGMKTILAALDDRISRVKSLAQPWASRFPKGYRFTVMGLGESDLSVSWSLDAGKYFSLQEAVIYNDTTVKVANSLIKQFIDSEYIESNFDVIASAVCTQVSAVARDLRPKRVKVLFTEYKLTPKAEVEPVQLPRGTSLDVTDTDIQSLMTLLPTLYSGQVLIKFVRALEYNAKEYWGESPDTTRALMASAIRGDGNAVAKYFAEFVATFDHSELPAFISGVKNIINSTDVFKGAVAPVAKADKIKPMQDARQAKYLKSAIQHRNGTITTVGELIKERVALGWNIAESETIDKAQSKALNNELKILQRHAPIGNKSHPDTIRLNELKGMVNKVWGEIRAMTPTTFLESSTGELMVLTPFGKAYAENLISTRTIRNVEPTVEKPIRERKTRVVQQNEPVELPVSASGLKPIMVKDDLAKFKARVARLAKKEVPATTLQVQKVRLLLKELGITNIDKIDYDMAEGFYSEHSTLLLLTKVGSAKFVANVKTVLATARDFGYTVYKLAKNEYCFMCETSRDLYILDLHPIPWDAAEKAGSCISVRRIRKP